MRQQQTEAATPEGVAAVVTDAAELQTVLDQPARYRMKGAVLLAPAALGEMEHIGLLATAVFNPFGPTVETLSLASFNGDWHTGRPVLLRRNLHPFTKPYIQVITEVYMQSETWRDHLAVILATFIGGNGASVASRSWAEPVLGAVPSGIVITEVGSQWTPEIRRGLAWLFQNTGDELREETEKICACGTNLRDQATWEMDRVRSLIAAPVTTDDSRGIPGIATVDDLNHFTEPAAFTEWWDRIAPVEYQQALHTQLPSAWHGAIGQVPGLAQLVAAGDTQGDSNAATCGGGGRNADFDAWWKLFRVGE